VRNRRVVWEESSSGDDTIDLAERAGNAAVIDATAAAKGPTAASSPWAPLRIGVEEIPRGRECHPWRFPSCSVERPTGFGPLRRTCGEMALASSISRPVRPVAPSTTSSWPLAASCRSSPTMTPGAPASRNSQFDRSKTTQGRPDPTRSASRRRRASTPPWSSSPLTLIWRDSAQITVCSIRSAGRERDRSLSESNRAGSWLLSFRAESAISSKCPIPRARQRGQCSGGSAVRIRIRQWEHCESKSTSCRIAIVEPAVTGRPESGWAAFADEAHFRR
jgi:hypothetical protein